ncbi:GNAT family N-acetyltransferase [Flavobacterium sp.]|jgi:ribosomal-protein-alanine N-acetyltransferase|uniref:GNAT family N-acetyltransferase n=1 Tax=Flavobacterium sp. TaxID=239 RepID=UPI002A817D78|nr:GNAT family N-acetyltransferase [Flavobacterium sp.]
MSKLSSNIENLKLTDSVELHNFILSNTERLKKYFPVTLSSNSTLEKTTEYIVTKNKEIEERSNFTFAIRNEKSIIIGLMILKKIDWTTKMGEFAYCIGSDQEGKGYTSKAVNEMMEFAFNELQLKTLQIIAHKTNIGSCKVAENCGFTWKKTLLNEFTPDNETPLDMELYELENEK